MGSLAAAAAAPAKPTAGKAGRDWSADPPIVEVTTTEDVVALGDVHGGYDRLVTLLSLAELVKPDRMLESGYAWTGGRRVLVSVGDLIDKGEQSLPTLELMMALEGEAAAAGGRVVVTLGNHEAEFLADPNNKKAKREFDRELKAKKLSREDAAAGRGRYGAWLVRRPVAARVNGWFFAHGGSTHGMSLPALAAAYRKAVDAADWGAEFLVGNDSILEAQKWWSPGVVDGNLAALGVRHVVFGHDPGAFEPRGHIAQRLAGKVFRIDVGMSPAIDDSQGALLVIHRTPTGEDATALEASGASAPLWSGAR